MKKLMDTEKSLYYFDSKDRFASIEFSRILNELIYGNLRSNQKIIILCIGSDRATGDCLGPIIGYKLNQYNNSDFVVYGTLEQPVHAKNLSETIDRIYEEHNDPFVIAIDASLGKSSHVGYITLGKGSLKPGAGVNKDLPWVGDLFITGIVNFSGYLDNMLLQTTRLNIVMNLADIISSGVKLFLFNHRKVGTHATHN